MPSIGIKYPRRMHFTHFVGDDGRKDIGLIIADKQDMMTVIATEEQWRRAWMTPHPDPREVAEQLYVTDRIDLDEFERRISP
jgi:hypothetical protein